MPDHVSLSKKITSIIDKLPVSPKSVVVYDIDNTLIDLQGKPLLPIISTYQHAKNRGFQTVIITARPGYRENILSTQKQLEEHGITGYKYMYFLPQDRDDPARFKYFSRQHIHEQGDEVVMSIGDMPWDIGVYGGIGVQII